MREIKVRLQAKVIDRIDHMVKEDGQTRQAFIRSAISRALKNWSSPLENDKLWPPCNHCRKRHDPELAHG